MKLVEMWDYGSKYVQEIKNPGGGGGGELYVYVGNFFSNVSLIFLRVFWNIYFNRGNLRLHRGVN